jgi:ribosome maturation factor RimP
VIDVKTIEAMVAESISEEQFIVELRVDTANKIYIELDDRNGPVSIKDCMALSRAIEGQLDREVEDFALEVTSPGLDRPFRVFDQYRKNIGRQVKVKDVDGKVIKGLLKSADEKHITIETREKKRIEGRKAKQWITEETMIPMDQVLETYVELVF